MTNDRMQNSEHRPRDDERAVPDPDGLEGREREDVAATPDGMETREPGGEAPTEDHLETSLPLEPGQGPRSPLGDALLDRSGSRHGVDARDERPDGA